MVGAFLTGITLFVAFCEILEKGGKLVDTSSDTSSVFFWKKVSLGKVFRTIWVFRKYFYHKKLIISNQMGPPTPACEEII